MGYWKLFYLKSHHQNIFRHLWSNGRNRQVSKNYTHRQQRVWRYEVKSVRDKGNKAEQVLTNLTRKLSQISQRTDSEQNCPEWVKFLQDIGVGARVRKGHALQPRTEQRWILVAWKAESFDRTVIFLNS